MEGLDAAAEGLEELNDDAHQVEGLDDAAEGLEELAGEDRPTVDTPRRAARPYPTIPRRSRAS